MLQRQIIFRQLQELQRKQQIQELGDPRNQHYINQLSSLKQALGGQLPSPVNGLPVHDVSQMLTVGKMQMMHGMPNEPVSIPSHNHFSGQVGLSRPQLDIYSQCPGLTDHSANLSTKNNNGPSLLSSMTPSSLGRSLSSPQSDLYYDQISIPDESTLPNQSYRQKNLYEQAPVQGFTSGISYGNYSHQVTTSQKSALPLESDGRQENEGWHELSPREVLKPALSDPASSLDPLEQNFLFGTDDNIWGSSFSRSLNYGAGAFESAMEQTLHMDGLPTTQSVSWSALMQSAIAETSCGVGGMQEDWSGLNFQNPDQLTDNQISNHVDDLKQHNNWVDNNSQSSFPGAKSDIVSLNSNISGTFPGFQQSGHQYLGQKEGFHSESSHASNQTSPRNTSQLIDHNCQQKHPVGVSQLFQGSSWPNICTGQQNEHLKDDAFHPSNNNQPGLKNPDHEPRVTMWLHESAPCDIQKPFDHHKIMVNQRDIQSYPAESEKVSSGKTDETMQTLLRAPSDLYGQNMASQTSNTMLDLFNKAGTSINHAAEMQGTSSSTCRSSHNMNDHFHSPASQPKSNDVATDDPMYSAYYSLLPNANFRSSEFQVLISGQITQPAVVSVSSQFTGSPTGLASKWVDMTNQPVVLSEKHQKSSNFIRSLNSEDNILETGSVPPNGQSSENSLKRGYSLKGFCASSGKPEYHEQQLSAETFLQKSLDEINNSISVSRYNQDKGIYRKRHLEANAVASYSSMTPSHQQPSDAFEQINTERPSCTDRDMKSLALSQNSAMLPQGQSLQSLAVTNSKDLFLHEQKGGVSTEAKGYLDETSQFGAFSSLDNQGMDLREASREQSDKEYLPNVQNMQMLWQNESLNCYNDNNNACNATYLSHISLQLAHSFSKHDDTLKNGQLFPTYDPKAASNTSQQLSGMTIERSMLPSTAATLLVSVQSSPNKFPSYVTCENMASVSKKRKIAFDMVPWHEEVNHDSFMLQKIRVAELEWAEALNRRPEEVKNEAEVFEDALPVFRAKRRLVFTTQLMQQVFQPSPAAILSSDAGSNCDAVAYFAARFRFADAFHGTSDFEIPSNRNDTSPDKLKTYKRPDASDYSELVERLINKVKKLEGELLRMDKRLSIVDIKVESQEMEKFSIINRFAKFHIKAQATGGDATPTVYKTYPQRYVLAHPMPTTVPEGTGCHSL